MSVKISVFLVSAHAKFNRLGTGDHNSMQLSVVTYFDALLSLFYINSDMIKNLYGCTADVTLL